MFWKRYKTYRFAGRYFFAIGITVLALWLQRVLKSDSHFNILLFLYPAGFFSVWFGGTGAGILSVILGSLGAIYWTVYSHDYSIDSLNHRFLELTGFILSGFLFGILIGLEKRARKKAQIAVRDLKSTALKLEDRERELSSALRSRDDFFSIASHELKTPVTALKLQVQLFQRDLQKTISSELTTKATKALSVMDNQITRLTNLVESLLDVTRISQGSLKLDLEMVDLAEMVRDICDRYSGLLKEALCKVKITSRGLAQVRCDRFRMEQVFINLLTNAAKYAPGTEIKLDLVRKRDFLEFSIKDEGPGISISHQEQIFTPFRRGTSLEKGIPGMGLGLFIVRQIIQSHGGEIQCESAPGKGTCFKLMLPLSAASSQTYCSLSFDALTTNQVSYLHRNFANSFSD
jgi:signal transduction histidine kinase